MKPSRTPRGTPAGGQFAPSIRPEPNLRLNEMSPPLDAVLGPTPAVIEFEHVYHVGSLDPTERKEWSYEGDGLSVSVHPEDWAQIARLPGDTHCVTRSDRERPPLRFVSWHDLDDPERDRIRNWGEENGWVEKRRVYRISYYDDELVSVVSMEFDGQAEAEDEAEAMGVDPDDPATAFEIIEAWRPTETFPVVRSERDDDPTDLLLAYYIRQKRPDLDGVWWEDELAPHRLSAPRGVIVHDLAQYDIRPAI